MKMDFQFKHEGNLKENKAMAQEIREISILYPKTSKEFCHHIKFLRSVMNGMCSI